MAPLLGSEEAGIGSILTAAGEDSPGVVPPVVTPTLAAVYAAGVGAPITDDLMAMTHGNMRFQAGTDAFALPVLGYWEDATGESLSTSGYPADLWSLASTLGTDLGRVFRVNQMFNPTWDGSFLGINGMSWQLEREAFTASATQAYDTHVATYGTRSLKVLHNNVPLSFPAGAAAGDTLRMESQIYNAIVGSLTNIEYQYGWGSYDLALWPKNNGITWQWATHWDNAGVGVPAAGDGLGWGIYSGDIDHTNHLQAGIAARQLTNDPNGDWQWSFYVSDGAGGLTDVADFARAGLTFNVPVTFASTPTPSSGVVTAYVATVDFRTPGFYVFNTPTVAGKHFVFLAGRAIFQTRDAALTTGPTIFLAQNGVDVSQAVAMSTAVINPQAAPENISASWSATALQDMTTFPLQLHVSVGAAGTGLTTCAGQFEIIGIYI